MATVKFTYALKRFFPDLKETQVQGNTPREILEKIEATCAGFKSYIVDDQGILRKHVNIFIDGEFIKDRQTLSDEVREDSEVYFMQALSGG